MSFSSSSGAVRSSRDEALRAHALLAFVRLARMVRDTISAASVQKMLDAIRDECRIVPGKNADTHLRFGRDLIVALRDTQAFLSIAVHELGHTMYDAAMLHDAPVSPEVLGGTPPAAHDDVALTELRPRDPGAGRRGACDRRRAVHAGRSRRALLSNGVSVLYSCSRDKGPFTEFSLTRRGGPIGLREAAAYACVVLDVLGVESSAAAYSDRGVFHVGFTGHGPDGDAVRARLATFEAAGIGARAVAEAEAWLASLCAADRLGRNAEELRFALGVSAAKPTVYGYEPERAWSDFELCRRARTGESVALRADTLPRAIASAVRAADAGIVRRLIMQQDPDQRKPSAGGNLAAVGSSMYVIVDRAARTYVGPRASSTYATMKVLAELGADPDESLDAQGNTLLLDAAARSLELTRALVAIGADVNRANAAGDTPLFAARSARIAEILCTAGADANAATPDGTTPLMRAAADGDIDLVRVLLQRGADADACTAVGETAAHYAVLHYGSTVREILEALFAAGAAVDEEMNDGTTPLMRAAAAANVDALRFLVERGANVNARTVGGATALTFAAGVHAQDAERILAGAKR